eukprot:43800-Prymnesium_polylepis.1
MDVRMRCERSGAEDRTVTWRAGPVDLIQPRRGVDDGTPGHPGELVARLCVVCRVRTVDVVQP